MAASTMTTCQSVRTGNHRKWKVDQNGRPGTIDEKSSLTEGEEAVVSVARTCQLSPGCLPRKSMTQ